MALAILVLVGLLTARVIRIERRRTRCTPPSDEDVRRRQEDQRRQRRREKSPDDRASERRGLLASFAKRKRGRDHARDHRETRHDYRPKAPARSLHDRGPWVGPGMPPVLPEC